MPQLEQITGELTIRKVVNNLAKMRAFPNLDKHKAFAALTKAITDPENEAETDIKKAYNEYQEKLQKPALDIEAIIPGEALAYNFISGISRLDGDFKRQNMIFEFKKKGGMLGRSYEIGDFLGMLSGDIGEYHLAEQKLKRIYGSRYCLISRKRVSKLTQAVFSADWGHDYLFDKPQKVNLAMGFYECPMEEFIRIVPRKIKRQFYKKEEGTRDVWNGYFVEAFRKINKEYKKYAMGRFAEVLLKHYNP